MRFSKDIRAVLLTAVALGALASAPPSASAQEAPRRTYSVGAQTLADALRTVSRISGTEIMFPAEAVRGRRAAPLSGMFTLREAIDRLLDGTGLVAEFRDDVVLIRGRSQPSGAPTGRPAERADVLVTGSRIAGRQSASPTILLTRAEMLSSGKDNLGDVMRSLPQNFSGGQNPGVGFNVPQNSGENNGSGSSFNLRGIGPDATLTLLNGQRLVYGGYRQSIDIGIIPLEAVDRLEIVTDGSSAIYGSDAVAGVANIILRRDYDGLETSARIGGATEGGYFQQRYAMLGGRKWSNGGIWAAYEFARDTAVESAQRAYAAVSNPGQTLYPSVKRHNALASGHQAITNNLTFAVDGLYSWRTDSRNFLASTAAGSPKTRTGARSWIAAVAPSLDWRISSGWSLKLAGSYGADQTHYETLTSTGGAFAPTLRGCFCNTAWSLEASAQARLFALPGGDVRIALGGGYRHNGYHGERTVGAPQNITAGQNVSYGFGEVSLPLVAPDMAVPAINSLTVSGAFRYERYVGVEDVVTPKFGVVLAPTPDFDLKASWGRSFKAPTLYQRFNNQTVTQYTARSRGGASYAATATALLLIGGNPDLGSEHAETYTLSLAVHPRAVPGLVVEANYFNVAFRNRVVVPITASSRSLSDPLYGAQVTYNPSAAAIASALQGRAFANTLAGSFDPSAVVAIIDNRTTNIAAQRIRGVDVSARYSFKISQADRLRLSASGSYLESEQRFLASSPDVPLAGTYFNPPHFRARGGVEWEHSRLKVGLFADYAGGVRDIRYTPVDSLDDMTTVDLTVQYRLPSGAGLMGDIDFVLSVQNIADQSPPYSRSTLIYEPPYDSTNYSPIGRSISFGITKRW